MLKTKNCIVSQKQTLMLKTKNCIVSQKTTSTELIQTAYFFYLAILVGMTIGPKSYRHPQKIPAMGRVKLHFHGSGLGYR